MTDILDQHKWFIIGFCASREGFNGEFAMHEHASRAVFAPESRRACFESVIQLLSERADIAGELLRLFNDQKGKTP